MLKSVPMGQSVDVVLRRGYPMLYNPDGCPKQSLEPVGAIQTPAGGRGGGFLIGMFACYCVKTCGILRQASNNPPNAPNTSPGLAHLTYSRTAEADGGAPGQISKLLPSGCSLSSHMFQILSNQRDTKA